MCGPSPTVNTKNAMKMVMNMFNQTLDPREYGIDTNNEDEGEDNFEAQFAGGDEG